MNYFEQRHNEAPVTLHSGDFTDVQWGAILKIFGLEEAERITIDGYTISGYGTLKQYGSEEEWGDAIAYLNNLIVEYVMLGATGQYALQAVLVPMKKRYDEGERTLELYEDIMNCE